MLCVERTNSGFEVRKWIDRLAFYLKNECRLVGPAFCHTDGSSYSSKEMNVHFHQLLEFIHSVREDLIPSSVDIYEDYNVFRSLRRGSTARTTGMKVPKNVIELHNRRKSTATSKGKSAQNSMSMFLVDDTGTADYCGG